jgi:two-component system copper resistance phosphate regulon response regulator CusR
MKVLIVEDSELLAQALDRRLAQDGHACDVAADGEAALAHLQRYAYDAVVLDLMLPRRDGLDVLRTYRTGGGTTPVLVLSARDQVGDRVGALDAGADDYLVKPFALDELRPPARAVAPAAAAGRCSCASTGWSWTRVRALPAMPAQTSP